MKKHNQLFNPFANPELQKSMERISKLEKEYVKAAVSSGMLSSTFANLQESIALPYRQIFQSCLQIAEISTVSQMDRLSSEITASIYESLRIGIENSPSFQSLNLKLSDSPPKPLDIPVSSNGSDDLIDTGFVILNASAVENYNLPEAVATTTSPGRKRMTVIDFIKLIAFIIGVISDVHSLLPSSPSDVEVKSLQIQEVQNTLLQTGNQILSDLFRDIDLSLSNVSDSLQSLKETVEEQDSELSSLKEAVDSFQQCSDSTKESLNTVPED